MHSCCPPPPGARISTKLASGTSFNLGAVSPAAATIRRFSAAESRRSACAACQIPCWRATLMASAQSFSGIRSLGLERVARQLSNDSSARDILAGSPSLAECFAIDRPPKQAVKSEEDRSRRRHRIHASLPEAHGVPEDTTSIATLKDGCCHLAPRRKPRFSPPNRPTHAELPLRDPIIARTRIRWTITAAQERRHGSGRNGLTSSAAPPVRIRAGGRPQGRSLPRPVGMLAASSWLDRLADQTAVVRTRMPVAWDGNTARSSTYRS